MLRIIFLIIGVCILLLALAFVFKRYARAILWSSATVLFAGTLLLVGFGVINPISENNSGSVEFWGTIIVLISSAALAFCAEMLKEKTKGKEKVQCANDGSTLVSEEQIIDAGEVILSGTLDTELARSVFAKAIESGFMEECGSHYKWKESKVLLAYMCGRIYCGDKPEFFKQDDKPYWKFGRYGFFPDTELNVLFDVSELGQSRANRKDLSVPTGSKKIDKLFE